MLFRNRSLDDLAQWCLVAAGIVVLDYLSNPAGPARAMAAMIGH